MASPSVSAGEALETDEVAVVADNVGPIICYPRYPQRWIEQITKAGREQLAIRRRFLSEGRSRGECHASIDYVGCSCRDRHRRRGLFLGPCRSLSRVVEEERPALGNWPGLFFAANPRELGRLAALRT